MTPRREPDCHFRRRPEGRLGRRVMWGRKGSRHARPRRRPAAAQIIAAPLLLHWSGGGCRRFVLPAWSCPTPGGPCMSRWCPPAAATPRPVSPSALMSAGRASSPRPASTLGRAGSTFGRPSRRSPLRTPGWRRRQAGPGDRCRPHLRPSWRRDRAPCLALSTPAPNALDPVASHRRGEPPYGVGVMKWWISLLAARMPNAIGRS